MSEPCPPGTLRLLLWPTLITAAISVARLTGEVQGFVTNLSGGRLALLGITWCVFVFGGWFGFRLARAGAAPRVRLAALWALLLLAATVGAVMWQFGPFVGQEPTAEAFAELRTAVHVLVAIAVALAAVAFALWPRLAWTMLCYALPARLLVLALTWLAKVQGWDTHYTKFGPPGIEPDDLATTMVAAATAQLGFWVPFTVLGGTFAGALFGRRRVVGS